MNVCYPKKKVLCKSLDSPLISSYFASKEQDFLVNQWKGVCQEAILEGKQGEKTEVPQIIQELDWKYMYRGGQERHTTVRVYICKTQLRVCHVLGLFLVVLGILSKLMEL